MSLGLALRVCSTSLLVKQSSGLVVLEDHEHKHKVKATKKLESYMMEKKQKEEDDRLRQNLWMNIERYFKPT